MDFSQTQKRPALDYGEHFCKRNQVMKVRSFRVKLGTNLFFGFCIEIRKKHVLK